MTEEAEGTKMIMLLMNLVEKAILTGSVPISFQFNIIWLVGWLVGLPTQSTVS